MLDSSERKPLGDLITQVAEFRLKLNALSQIAMKNSIELRELERRAESIYDSLTQLLGRTGSQRARPKRGRFLENIEKQIKASDRNSRG